MTKPDQGNELKFTVPARYCICVKGFLDESWSHRLSGMQISNQVPDKQSPTAEITGEVRDQTELIGVINSLYEMHMPLISVTFLNKATNEKLSQMKPKPDDMKKGDKQ